MVSKSKVGAFVSIGLERDVLIPFREQKYEVEVGGSYLFYIYLDKTGRIAASTDVDRYLDTLDMEDAEAIEKSKYRVGDEFTGVVYGFQTNGSAMVAVDRAYKGVILVNEYFSDLKRGDEIKVRIKKIYEDGRLGLTPRKRPVEERTALQEEILDYLKKSGGSMAFNDKSSPEDIKRVFHQSKNYFKNALGGLMKKGLIEQDEKGTRLKNQ